MPETRTDMSQPPTRELTGSDVMFFLWIYFVGVAIAAAFVIRY